MWLHVAKLRGWGLFTKAYTQLKDAMGHMVIMCILLNDHIIYIPSLSRNIGEYDEMSGTKVMLHF